MLRPIIFDATPIDSGKKLNIPWGHIKSEFVCAAMDKSKRVHAFREVPKLRLTVWMGDSGNNLNALDIDVSGVDFKNSLTMRP